MASFSQYSWIVGVILAAIASIISNFGLNLQKLSHQKALAIHQHDVHAKSEYEANYHKSPMWITGLILTITGSIADFVALAFAGASIVAPLGSLTLVSNVFFAPIMLGESLSRHDVMATMTIVLGSAIAVAFATHEETKTTLDELFSFFLKTRFIIYALLIGITVGAMWYAILQLEKLQQDQPQSERYMKVRKYHRFLYASMSGIIGAQSVLFAKCAAELVVHSIAGDGLLFLYWQTYFILFAMTASILLQIKWLNSGLLRFDAVSVVPIFQSFWILVSVIAGLVFFGEATDFSATQAFFFPLGVFLTIGGVIFLSRRGVHDERSEAVVDDMFKYSSVPQHSTPASAAAAAVAQDDDDDALLLQAHDARHQSASIALDDSDPTDELSLEIDELISSPSSSSSTSSSSSRHHDVNGPAKSATSVTRSIKSTNPTSKIASSFQLRGGSNSIVSSKSTSSSRNKISI